MCVYVDEVSFAEEAVGRYVSNDSTAKCLCSELTSFSVKAASFKLVLANSFGTCIVLQCCLLTAAKLFEGSGACISHVTLTVVQRKQRIVDHQMWSCDAEPQRMNRRM